MGFNDFVNLLFKGICWVSINWIRFEGGKVCFGLFMKGK